jgi:hypothetical protein
MQVNEKLVGALTADALDPHAFDHLDQRFPQGCINNMAKED